MKFSLSGTDNNQIFDLTSLFTSEAIDREKTYKLNMIHFSFLDAIATNPISLDIEIPQFAQDKAPRYVFFSDGTNTNSYAIYTLSGTLNTNIFLTTQNESDINAVKGRWTSPLVKVRFYDRESNQYKTFNNRWIIHLDLEEEND